MQRTFSFDFCRSDGMSSPLYIIDLLIYKKNIPKNTLKKIIKGGLSNEYGPLTMNDRIGLYLRLALVYLELDRKRAARENIRIAFHLVNLHENTVTDVCVALVLALHAYLMLSRNGEWYVEVIDFLKQSDVLPLRHVGERLESDWTSPPLDLSTVVYYIDDGDVLDWCAYARWKTERVHAKNLKRMFTRRRNTEKKHRKLLYLGLGLIE